MGRQIRNTLFQYPGALSSLAAKTDIAYATRLIGDNLHKSIHALRRLRNAVAHEPAYFTLEGKDDKIKEMCSFGINISSTLNEVSTITVLRRIISIVKNDPAMKDERLRMDEEEILKHLREDPNYVKAVREKSRRGTLGLIVALICATLILRWESIKASFPGDRLIQ